MTERQARAIARKRIKYRRDHLGFAVVDDEKNKVIDYAWNLAGARDKKAHHVEELVKEILRTCDT